MKRPRNNRRHRHDRSGIILLVVLSMLAFFSVMAAAYLVFSSQNRQTSFAIATRNIKQPNTNAFMEEALMMLIRGTNDGKIPFFGEDLLSDYYGRKDVASLTTNGAGVSIEGSTQGGYVRVPVAAAGSPDFDDVFAGRIMTFRGGVVEDRSYRVLRSTFISPANHELIIELDPDLSVSDVTTGLKIWVNGRPRNSPGLGYNGTNRDQVAGQDSFGTPVGYNDLPVAFQPNHLTLAVDKNAVFKAATGDYDEPSDVADFDNWFLSHRHPDGTVIPSFHRPSVINYILNEESNWSSFNTTTQFSDVMASIARATMRPIPIHADQIGNTDAINERFTGGNPNFALRVPIDVNNAARLDQIAKVLTGSVPNAYDVDNDMDGVNDSIWIDLGLPVFTSPDGKLIKPLIAPMIEDLSGRLNVNAHGNYGLTNTDFTNAGLTNPGFGLQGFGNLWAERPVNPFVFRGLGFGPAEINIPLNLGVDSAKYPTADDLVQLLNTRYLESDPTMVGVPGLVGPDPLNVLTSGWRPPRYDRTTLYPSSVDPYGRGGIGISGSGNIVSTNSGIQSNNDPNTSFTEPITTEASDNPYELDPSGRLAGDRPFSAAELEAVLRSKEFGSEMLPGRLRQLLQPFVAADPDFLRKLTTISLSDDSPAMVVPGEQAIHVAIAKAINPAVTDAQLKRLIAPELRLSNRLNVNRAIGNGVDDSAAGTLGEGVIDEPAEVDVATGDESNRAFASAEDIAANPANYQTSVPNRFQNLDPTYTFDEPATLDPRQLLARHLYVLMMTLSKDLETDYPSFGDTLGITPLIPLDRKAYRARRMAQWAVNVVDYRDPDSIMTQFEYDENISDGWNVDGDVTTNEGGFRKIVFGVENPELVFTESMAIHDLRVRDTDLESAGKKKGPNPGDDDDTDQVRIPQGSLFLELYCPRERVQAGAIGTELSGFPAELYDLTSGSPTNYKLDLTRTVSDAVVPAVKVPVWRIAISVPHVQSPNEDGDSPLFLRKPQNGALPDTLSFEPAKLNELDSTPALALERFVFFTDFTRMELNDLIAQVPDMQTGNPARDLASVFFNQSGVAAGLRPEEYLSLVPRTTTYIGSETYAIDPTKPSNQRFERINNDGLIHFDLNNNRVTPDTTTTTQPGVGLVISGFAPSTWTGLPNTAPEGIGLNVSEPLAINSTNYYTEPRERYTTVAGTLYPRTDAYVELAAGGTPVDPLKLPIDKPEDMKFDAMLGRQLGPIYELTVRHVGETVVADPMLGSFANYRTAFLQRLADPTADFDPMLNPYRTVDQIPIDITIFSGEETPLKVTAQGQAPIETEEIDYLIGSRQRDGIQKNPVTNIVEATNVLHSYSTEIPNTSGVTSGMADYFVLAGGTGYFETTFNHLNTRFAPFATVGLRGRPATPFAMHPWLNRPFASPYELMLVPACSQGRLFEEFSAVALANPDPAVYPGEISATTDIQFVKNFIGPYRHLLNFFHSAEVKKGGQQSTQFATLFDLVGTPPRFRGELEPINPTRVASAPMNALFSAPFNMIDDNQRIGRININTLAEFDVWKGLMQGHSNPLETTVEAGGAVDQSQLSFDSFLESRRGFTPPGAAGSKPVTGPGPYNYAPKFLDARYPTQFAGVFKSSVNGKFAPLLRGDPLDLRRRPSSASLLRGLGTLDQLDPTDGSAPTTLTPMFVRHSSQKPTSPTGMPNEFFLNRSRNPFVRYQTLMRMPNLVSDNSQVFVIRMTMGFFEVDADNINSLGAEYNANVGKNQRQRAMFIVDRSIPVGFIPGRDVNARDIVIFESYTQ